MKFKELSKEKVSDVEQSIIDSWGGLNAINNKQIEKIMNDDRKFREALMLLIINK